MIKKKLNSTINTVHLIILMVFMFLTFQEVKAQQEPQFTQYMDNMLYYNPAYAGSKDMMSINALHRHQWAGIRGAPISTTVGFQTPLSIDNLGIGVTFINDRVGPTNAMWANADVSYAIRFKNGGKLAFGMKAGINQIDGDFYSLTKNDYTDDIANFTYDRDLKLNIGAGAFYYSKQWFIGGAIPRIVESSKKIEEQLDGIYNIKRHYYLMAGGYLNANQILKIRPHTMFKFTEGAPFALDVGVDFILYEKFWIGANYRLTESAAIIAQFQITPQFKAGYAFEFSTTKLGTNSSGTHELMLNYDFIFKGKGLKSPRYF